MSFKNLVLSSEYHYVKVNGESISLTSKEFELLYLLMKYPGKVFTRDEMVNNWIVFGVMSLMERAERLMFMYVVYV